MSQQLSAGRQAPETTMAGQSPAIV